MVVDFSSGEFVLAYLTVYDLKFANSFVYNEFLTFERFKTVRTFLRFVAIFDMGFKFCLRNSLLALRTSNDISITLDHMEHFFGLFDLLIAFYITSWSTEIDYQSFYNKFLNQFSKHNRLVRYFVHEHVYRDN
jgi:hypothetical protein